MATDLADPASLADVTMSALDTGGCLHRLPVPRDVVRAFLDEIEAGYDTTVPYHNVEHVKGVVRATGRIWHECGLREAVRALTPGDIDVEELAVLLAAAVHDHQHRGLSNDFLIRTLHPYALAHKCARCIGTPSAALLHRRYH